MVKKRRPPAAYKFRIALEALEGSKTIRTRCILFQPAIPTAGASYVGALAVAPLWALPDPPWIDPVLP